MSIESPSFIHVFLPGKSDRTLLVLHGTGGNESSLIPLAQELDPRASILSVRGKVLEDGAPRFFRRFAEGVFDLDDLRFRAQELADFLVWASGEYGFKTSSLLAVGYSNGANIAAALLLLRPEVLGGAVLFRPTLPLTPTELPRLAARPVFISAGLRDPLVPASGTRSLEAILHKAGADVALNWEESSHGLTRGEVAKAGSWLAASQAD